jgi:transcriptional regulator EpsA
VSQLVILSKTEQEYLLRIIESSITLRERRALFLWSQGQLQALLPHQLMVCMHFGVDGALLRIDPLHASVRDEAAIARLCDPRDGLALRIARHCSASAALPCMAELREADPSGALAPFHAELADCGYDNLIVHGSGPVAGGATVFALFGLPMRAGARHAYFLSLLLPHLHLALLRLAHAAPQERSQAARRPLSARETEILKWLREGKRNQEIALILGISSLTVKNHLQRIYKLLDVHNRTAAVARSDTGCDTPATSIDLAYPQVKTAA